MIGKIIMFFKSIDIPGWGVEHLVHEYVQVHIFHHPGDLPDQAEEGESHPEFFRQFRFHTKVLSTDLHLCFNYTINSLTMQGNGKKKAIRHRPYGFLLRFFKSYQYAAFFGVKAAKTLESVDFHTGILDFPLYLSKNSTISSKRQRSSRFLSFFCVCQSRTVAVPSSS